MVAHRDTRRLCPTRHQRLEAMNQLCAQRVVMGQCGKGKAAIPGTHFGVMDGRAILVRAGNKVLGNPLANLLGREPGRPVGEICSLLRERT